MPAVSIFSIAQYQSQLKSFLPQLQEFISIQLSGQERYLVPAEVSIRLIAVGEGSIMISPIELEITAHAYVSRIQRQDEICKNVARFIGDCDPYFKNLTHVWLKLCELGHSWEEKA